MQANFTKKIDETNMLPSTTGMVSLGQNSKLKELNKEQNPP